MLKKKVFDIADSNIANLGSEVDKKCKLASAQGEKAWDVAGKKEGLQIWRIEQFKVVPWPQPQYGQFYTGDSYIVLDTKKDKENPAKLKWEIHFWLGTSTSQDEAGTAAYKTVELDTVLGGAPVQHREVESKESAMFCSYFNNTGGLRILEGGTESGFNHVKPTEYKPRLLHLKGRKNVRVVQVDLTASSLNEGDVFILDNGLTLYQWQGKGAGIKEKARGAQLARALDDERKGAPKVVVLDQGDKDVPAEFWALLGGEKAPAADTGGDEKWEGASEKRLFQLTDSSGCGMEFNLVGSGERLTRDKLDSKDAFILDAGPEVFVWIGKGASKNEKTLAMKYATQYLTENKRPNWLPITRILEGGENDFFESLFNAASAGSIKKAVPTASGSACATGSGCYLSYAEASNGTLFLNWSYTPVDGAIAYIQPSVNVPAHKFKTQAGRSELTRSIDSAPKNGFQGWCNYLKMAKEFKAPFTLLTDDVTIMIHDDDLKLHMIERGVAFDVTPMATPAVGVFSKSNSAFEGAINTGRDHFLNTCQGLGAALVLPKGK